MPDAPHDQTDALDHPEAERRITKNRIIAILVALIVLVLLSLLAIAVVPRWYAQRVGTMVDGRLLVGGSLGVVTGMVFTSAPLIFFGVAARRMRSLGTALTAIVVGLVLALPNLITLSIVLGAGSAAHAGQRVLDVEGPGFRAGTLIGAIIGALFAAWIIYLMLSRRRRGRRLAELKAEESATKPAARPESGD